MERLRSGKRSSVTMVVWEEENEHFTTFYLHILLSLAFHFESRILLARSSIVVAMVSSFEFMFMGAFTFCCATMREEKDDL